MKDFEPGVTAPPFHVYCRSTTVPYFNDEWSGGERAARDADGNTYYVPSDMKYADWKESFVDGESKDGLQKIDEAEKKFKNIQSGQNISNNATKVEKIKTYSESSTETLCNAYEARRKHFNLNETPAAELRESVFDGLSANYKGVSVETAKAFDETISKLSDEYYTGLTKIEVGDKKKFFGVRQFATTSHNNAVGQKVLTLNPQKTSDFEALKARVRELSDSGYAVNIAEGKEGQYIATHEFAHSLIDMESPLKNYIGYDVAEPKIVRKKIKQLYTDYMNEIKSVEDEIALLKKDPAFTDFSTNVEDQMKVFKKLDDAQKRLSEIKISGYSTENADEFMAEAFTDVKIGVEPSEYSKQVVNVIDKYFKKDIEKSTKSVIIKLSNREVREQYIDMVSKIKDSIDDSLPIEEKARHAFEARNRMRTKAREMMADEETRKMLDKEKPNLSFEELIKSKIKRKGMTREESIQDIYETATKTNGSVNKELGIGGE